MQPFCCHSLRVRKAFVADIRYTARCHGGGLCSSCDVASSLGCACMSCGWMSSCAVMLTSLLASFASYALDSRQQFGPISVCCRAQSISECISELQVKMYQARQRKQEHASAFSNWFSCRMGRHTEPLKVEHKYVETSSVTAAHREAVQLPARIISLAMSCQHLLQCNSHSASPWQ